MTIVHCPKCDGDPLARVIAEINAVYDAAAVDGDDRLRHVALALLADVGLRRWQAGLPRIPIELASFVGEIHVQN